MTDRAWFRKSFRGIGVRQVRLGCGVVLFAYLVSHFLNHALGNISMDALAAGVRYHIAFWRMPPVAIVFYGAALIHAGLGIWALYQRRQFRWKAIEPLQLVLGLSIPMLVISHIVGVRLGQALLTGDAAGLATRDLCEGIGPAIRSGLRAADAILGNRDYALTDVTGASLGGGWVSPMLAVACARCERRGRYWLDNLIARHGADAGVRVIVPNLTANCPQRDSVALMERCDVLFPELLALFRVRVSRCAVAPAVFTRTSRRGIGAHRSTAMIDHDEHSASFKTLSVTVAAGIAVGIALIVLVIWLLRHMS